MQIPWFSGTRRRCLFSYGDVSSIIAAWPWSLQENTHNVIIVVSLFIRPVALHRARIYWDIVKNSN